MMIGIGGAGGDDLGVDGDTVVCHDVMYLTLVTHWANLHFQRFLVDGA